MHKVFLRSCCALVVLAATSLGTVHAGLMTGSDDQFSWVTDTSTGYEWLNLNHTVGLALNEVEQQTARGERFQNWNVATQDQVYELFRNGLVLKRESQCGRLTTCTIRRFFGEGSGRYFSHLIGETAWQTSAGYVSDRYQNGSIAQAVVPYADRSGVSLTYWFDSVVNPHIATWLVRDPAQLALQAQAAISVNAPWTAPLLCFGLLALFTYRRVAG